MGNNKFDNRTEREQYEDRGFIVYTFDRHNLRNSIQRATKMAETKIAVILLNLLGIPLCFYAFIENLDNIKGAVLFILALCFLMIRMYFFVVWAKQKTQRNELDKQKTELENDRRRLENMKLEQELAKRK